MLEKYAQYCSPVLSWQSYQSKDTAKSSGVQKRETMAKRNVKQPLPTSLKAGLVSCARSAIAVKHKG